MIDPRKEIGRLGEELAMGHVEKRGLEILSRNWRTRLGELDIIASDGSQIIFIEVRTTTSVRFGMGFQSVNGRKQQQVRRIATQFLQQHRLGSWDVRFDVISILLDRRTREIIQLQHLEGVF